jgi:hypothetical protein
MLKHLGFRILLALTIWILLIAIAALLRPLFA